MDKGLLNQKITNLSKRIRISRAQQMTLLEIGVTALIVGASAMLIIFLAKYIGLNANVIGAKNQALDNYGKTIANVGICIDKNNDGKVDANELSGCNPNDITLEQIPNTLQSNVMTKTAYDKALNSVVSRGTLAESCLDANRQPIDFLKAYQDATDDKAKAKALESIKTCSALRIIPDALPAQQNVEGAIASLNWLLNQANVSAETLSPDDNSSSTGSNNNVDTIPISLMLETGTQDAYRALSTIERSIRAFDVNTMTLEWGGSNGRLSFALKMNAYYSGKSELQKITQTVTTKGVRKGN